MRSFGLSDILTRTMARLGIRKESNKCWLATETFQDLGGLERSNGAEMRAIFSSLLNGEFKGSRPKPFTVEKTAPMAHNQSLLFS